MSKYFVRSLEAAERSAFRSDFASSHDLEHSKALAIKLASKESKPFGVYEVKLIGTAAMPAAVWQDAKPESKKAYTCDEEELTG